jgi:hypothetical protein
MQIAEILSDLTSLRVCVSILLNPSPNKNALCLEVAADTAIGFQDHDAAMALVTSHERIAAGEEPTRDVPLLDSTSMSAAESSKKAATARENAPDPDLQRALDLIDLHENVKRKHMQGMDVKLEEARRLVERTLRGMDIGGQGAERVSGQRAVTR